MENSSHASADVPTLVNGSATLTNSLEEEMIQRLTTVLVPVTFGIILSIGFIGNFFVIIVVSNLAIILFH